MLAVFYAMFVSAFVSVNYVQTNKAEYCDKIKNQSPEVVKLCKYNFVKD